MSMSDTGLRKLIRNLIKESLNLEDSRSIQDTIENLNNVSEELMDYLKKSMHAFDTDVFDMYIPEKLDELIGNFQSDFEFLDEGAFRKVYALPNQKWVLKLAIDVEGAKVNRQEIQMSGIDQNDDVYHGHGARNIFTKVYDYDRLNDLPWWIMSQRVIPLSDVNDINLLRIVFPTFYNILNSVAYKDQYNISDIEKKMINPFCFTGFITNILTQSVIKMKKVKKLTKGDKGWDFLNKKQLPPYYSNLSYKGITNKNIYDTAFSLFNGNLLPMKEISFERDIEKLSRGLAYVGTTDLHEGNIGIVSSAKPSPDDIVILDFDIYS